MMTHCFSRFLPLFLLPWVLVSCGGNTKTEEIKTDAPNPKTPDTECVHESSFALKINKKNMQGGSSFTADQPQFEVLFSQYILRNDSTADLRFSNYTPDQFNGSLSGQQMDVLISLRTRNKSRFEPGEYAYMDFERDSYAKVNIMTAKGAVWFNWATGMPDPGGVTVFSISKESVCGKVQLAVDKPDNRTIGTVILSGHFYLEAK